MKVLESYDFTVDESSVQYQQVAIDPEMLGRIFENLLASQNPETEKLANQRKAFGAFYTPREIVEYMVDASLRAYLEEVLMPSEKASSSKVKEPVVSYSGTLFHELEPKQTEMSLEPLETYSETDRRKKIGEKIDKLFSPICDSNPFDKRETQVVQNALRDIRVLDPACGSGAFPIGMLLRLMSLREIVGNSLNSTYELKNEILSRNIYGVDIMPMAVEIARLRAWLSLVLEVDYKLSNRKHNFNIKALPNLDFKFICANSLIESDYDEFNKKIGATPSLLRFDNEIKKLESLREKYFDTHGDKLRKSELQKEFIQTKKFIKSNFSSLKKTWNLKIFLDKVDDWDPFDDSHASSFFSVGWMFGIIDGFDVVIGNPPYILLQNSGLADTYIKKLISDYYCAQYKVDTYHLFIEKGISFLRNCGILAFITPNTFLKNTHSNRLREIIVEKTQLLSIILFYVPVFEDPSVDNLVFLCKKNKLPNYHTDRDINIHDIKTHNFREEVRNFRRYSQSKIKSPNYIFEFDASDNEAIILSKIERNCRDLGNIGRTYFGIQTFDRRKFVSVNQKNENYKPVIDGGNIFRYLISEFKEYLDYRPENIKSGGDSDVYRKRRIVVRQIGRYPEGSICPDGLLTLNTIYNIYLTSNDFDIKYILALLNSKLVKFYWLKKFYDNKETFPKIKKKPLESIPIKIANNEKQMFFIKIVDTILSLTQSDNYMQNKEKQAKVKEYEKQINQQVYQLYDLIPEEIKIVEGGDEEDH